MGAQPPSPLRSLRTASELQLSHQYSVLSICPRYLGKYSAMGSARYRWGACR